MCFSAFIVYTGFLGFEGEGACIQDDTIFADVLSTIKNSVFHLLLTFILFPRPLQKRIVVADRFPENRSVNSTPINFQVYVRLFRRRRFYFRPNAINRTYNHADTSLGTGKARRPRVVEKRKRTRYCLNPMVKINFFF